jgi:hypothetical protein
MPDPIAIVGTLALVSGLVFLLLRVVGRRWKGYRWQPDLSYRVNELSTPEENNSTRG